MHVLFVHQNFPAQFGHIAGWLVERLGWQCTFVTQAADATLGGVRRIPKKVVDKGGEAYDSPLDALLGAFTFGKATAAGRCSNPERSAMGKLILSTAKSRRFQGGDTVRMHGTAAALQLFSPSARRDGRIE